jgi:transposase
MQIDIENASKEELQRAYQVITSQYQILKATHNKSEENNKNLKAQYEVLTAQYQKSEEKITLLEHQLEWFKKQYFGAKSERLIPQDPKQGNLFEVPEAPPSQEISVKSYERSGRKTPTNTDDNSRIRFDEKVPVEEIIVLPEEVKDLATNEYEVIGEKVTERLHQIPSTFKVVRTIRKTVKLKDKLITAAAPYSVIERSFADGSFLGSLITEKFQYHLPLYRQHQRMEHAGVHISRGYLTTLVHRTLELLEPVYLSLLSDITTSEVVSMDETPIKAGRKENGKMKKAYFWPVFAENQVAFVYSSTRAHAVVSEVLGQGCKKLMSDGYEAYSKYASLRPELIHAECYAHVRRKFFEAKDHSPTECDYILSLIQELFRIEKDITLKEPEEVLALRRYYSSPIVSNLFRYCEDLWHTKMVLKESLLGEAINYTLKRKKELSVFLEHADIPLSNNHVERSIRPVAVGRKNWMFCWSEVGARYAAIAYSLVESCKLSGVDPWEYFVDVLTRIDAHPAKNVHLLIPRNWKDHFSHKRKNAV